MKCPNCDGKGYWQEDMPNKFMGKFKQTKVWECSVCHGSGEIKPQTNEEWLRTATTEELAEMLFDIYETGLNCGEWYGGGKGFCVPAGPKMLTVEDFVGWLRKKHDEWLQEARV